MKLGGEEALSFAEKCKMLCKSWLTSGFASTKGSKFIRDIFLLKNKQTRKIICFSSCV